MKAIKGCVELSSKYTFLADICFIVSNTFWEASAEVLYYYGPAKTRQKVFSLATLEKSTKECLGGSYLVMNIDPIVPGDIPIFHWVKLQTSEVNKIYCFLWG